MSIPHFDVPLNLPHAATVATRIHHHVSGLVAAGAETLSEEAVEALESRTDALVRLLQPFALDAGNPAPRVVRTTVEKGAALARELVDEIERAGIGSDRLGQAVRNLFECFELGEEGASLSLRAGEDPSSVLRPI